ncbi:MAG TPA: rod shape-determining protein MreC [Solimonas sp.]|nr:rod shape-determining protein MreC [Solimonas sp.]
MNTLPETYRRPLFPRGPGLGLRTFFLLLIACALMFNDSRGDSLKGFRAGFSYALTPLVWLASAPSRLLDAAAGLDSRETLEDENHALKAHQLVLEARLQKLEALEAENRRIRELLASAANLEDQVLIAEIIDLNQDPYRHQITLNKGTRDGVYRGQALVDAHGVMGQVVQVAPNNAKALLITDPDHGIPIEVNRTGLQTIAVGRGDERGLRLPFLPSNADIKVGDLLVSSALGGRFPAGYPVGQVYEVKHVAGEHFMEAYAYPAARLNQGRQALLVWSESYPVTLPEAEAAEPAETAPEAPATP